MQNRGKEACRAEASWAPLVLSTSDDNLLKNIELFDKLALRFHGRLLFLKDVLGDEICCWSFYGQGRKIAEVCCTSIVYATEKKQTKVRWGFGAWSGRAVAVGRISTLDRGNSSSQAWEFHQWESGAGVSSFGVLAL